MKNLQLLLFLLLSITIVSSCNKDAEYEELKESTLETVDFTLDDDEVIAFISSIADASEDKSDAISPRWTYKVLFDRDLSLVGPNLVRFRAFYNGKKADLGSDCKVYCYLKHYGTTPISLYTSGFGIGIGSTRIKTQEGNENPKISVLEYNDLLKIGQPDYQFMAQSFPNRAYGKMIIYQICP